METIRKYVTEGDIVVELGVRFCVSTWALMANKPSVLVSVDVVDPPEANLKEVVEAAKENNIEFKFMKGNSYEVEIFPHIDVLFVDTLHFYSQVIKELMRHAENTRKYIIFHDSKISEVRSAIHDFLWNSNWQLVEENPADTGLMVLQRVNKAKFS